MRVKSTTHGAGVSKLNLSWMKTVIATSVTKYELIVIISKKISALYLKLPLTTTLVFSRKNF